MRDLIEFNGYEFAWTYNFKDIDGYRKPYLTILYYYKYESEGYRFYIEPFLGGFKFFIEVTSLEDFKNKRDICSCSRSKGELETPETITIPYFGTEKCINRFKETVEYIIDKFKKNKYKHKKRATILKNMD